MNLRNLVESVRRSWVVLLVCVALGLVGGIATTLLQRPVYTATASVFVSVQSRTDPSDLAQGGDFTQGMVQSYAQLAEKPIVLDAVIQQLGLPLTSARLATMVDVSAPLDTVLIEIRARAQTPTLAARVANSVSTNLIAAVPEVTFTTGQNASPVKITPIESAAAPTSPTTPSLPLNLLLGLAAGLVLAVLLIVVREALDVRIIDQRDAERAGRRRVLGTIPADRGAARNPLISQSGASSERSEAFRSLRTQLQFLDFGPGAPTVVVTAASQGAGASTTAANLAVAAADAGIDVVLVDSDLRSPSLAKAFNLEPSIGLAEVLRGDSDLAAAQQTLRPGLSIIPAGRTPANPSELLQSPRMTQLIDELSRNHEMVVLDSPPVLFVSDAASLSRRASGALIVCAIGRTGRGELSDSVAALEQIGAQTLGFVATGAPSGRRLRARRVRSGAFDDASA